MGQPYKRKTTNPNMGWSEERKAAWSARIRDEMAKGIWRKKSKKAISKAISNGRIAANRKKRLSEARKNGWETRRKNGNGTTKLPLANVTPSNSLDTAVGKDLQEFLNKVESVLGVKVTMKDFIEQAIKEKLSEICLTLQKRA